MLDFLNTSSDLSVLFMSALALFFASFTSLFSVANPTAALPIFLSLTKGYTPGERSKTALWTTIYMMLILVTFLLVGTYILNFFGISLAGIRIAGGLIIMRAAYSMLNPNTAGRKLSEEDEAEAREKDDITFSPLAMPMLSGPGSIAVVIGFATQATGPTDYMVHIVSIFLVVLIAYIVLRLGPFIMNYMGTTGMNVLTRMMGFIALAISVQFILSGIARYFNIAL
ncbi:MAG: MarC family NAAT transporter [Balneolaceae bacterium]